MIFSMKNRLKMLIFLSAGLFIAIGFFTPGPEVAGVTIGRLGLLESVLGALIVAFNRWLWRVRPFCWMKTGPDLRGTWKGTMTSTFDNQTRTAYIAIRQTFSEIEVRLLTEESTSETTSSQLLRRPDDLSIIEYSYNNVPRALVRKRSEIHFGAARLECTGQSPDRIEGSYWTDRKTTGELVFVGRSKKVIQTFAEASAELGA